MTESPGIYAIRLMSNGRAYVGSASNISKRWSRHRKDLRGGKHSNAHLQAAWIKYGEAAFVFEVLELTDDLTAREQFWMDRLDVVAGGFNLCPVARSSRGRPWTCADPAARSAAMSRGLKGRTGYGVSIPVRYGEDNPVAKLTQTQADDLRARYGHLERRRGPKSNGEPSLATIGAEYGISAAQVCVLLQGKSYRGGRR